MKLRRILTGVLAATTVLSCAACTQTNESSTTTTAGTTAAAGDTVAADNEAADTEAETGGDKLTLTVLTHRTDRKEDGTLDAITDAFEEANNCTVVYQGFTNYADDVSTMLNTTEYGDVLMIPDSVKLSELHEFFEPLGSYAELSEKYNWVDRKMFDQVVYGIPFLGSVSGGICYNKRIWSEAGITEMPKTPDEFIADLKLISENTDAIPYYTNFADANWTISQWSSLCISATGKPSIQNDILSTKRDLFIEGDGYHDVFKLMFDVFSDPTLLEADPMTSNWEASKKAINEGKIATMVMGSWAVAQFQEAGEFPDDVGYMPAPFSVDGVQYAESSGDYSMGINKNRSDEIKELGKKYIEWFIGESGFAQQEGSICTLKGSELPSYLDAFSDVTLFVTDVAPDGLAGVWDEIDKGSEVGIFEGDAANFKIQIAEAAFAGKSAEDFEAILADCNARWRAAYEASETLNAYTA